MPECPRCHQAVDVQAIACPYCRTPLKAYGHPGMTLHHATGDEPLCVTCVYDEDDTCTLPKRPYAKDCTLYRDRNQTVSSIATQGYTRDFQIKTWIKRNLGWILLLGLILFSLTLTLLR
ncbi:zinc ribbon domain-containing protein [Leptothermofonsia sp. ETS-13]|uniref:zinc ribbon domain-containing protein n=1 Tax=Leptothermofonsia sp. ETS-13 TaxID=3035696 RepID=UPI003BA023A2